MVINGEIKRRELANRYELRNRYVFEGRLVMQTALHIGGGRVTLSSSDSPVVLTPDQKPFIPGSSFKGALRSTVEKIVPSLPTEGHFSSCALIELDESELQARRENKEPVCSTMRQGEIAQQRRNEPGRAQAILREAIAGLCDTCLLFGSPFAAARLSVDDLYMPAEEWSGVTQIRDGVAIDRDSEKAKDRLKYDFEVVPASASFGLRIVLENATERDRQLIWAGLSEFVHGFGVIGGKRSRGLGVSRLEDLKVFALELEGDGVTAEMSRQRLRDYLVTGELPQVDSEQFLHEHIDSIFGEPRS